MGRHCGSLGNRSSRSCPPVLQVRNQLALALKLCLKGGHAALQLLSCCSRCDQPLCRLIRAALLRLQHCLGGRQFGAQCLCLCSCVGGRGLGSGAQLGSQGGRSVQLLLQSNARYNKGSVMWRDRVSNSQNIGKQAAHRRCQPVHWRTGDAALFHRRSTNLCVLLPFRTWRPSSSSMSLRFSSPSAARSCKRQGRESGAGWMRQVSCTCKVAAGVAHSLLHQSLNLVTCWCEAASASSCACSAACSPPSDCCCACACSSCPRSCAASASAAAAASAREASRAASASASCERSSSAAA